MRKPTWISAAAAPHASELLSAKRLEFCAAGFTETAKKVERPAICHLPQLGECLVRLQIRIEDRSFDSLGVLEDCLGGQDAHPSDFGVKPDQGGNVRIIVLQRVDMAFRSLLDELFVQLLAQEFFLRQPLRPRLRLLNEPRCKTRCKSSYSGSHQRRKSGYNRCVHKAIVSRSWQGEDDHRRRAGATEESRDDARRGRNILFAAKLVADDAAADRAPGVEAIERLAVADVNDQEVVVEIP